MKNAVQEVLKLARKFDEVKKRRLELEAEEKALIAELAAFIGTAPAPAEEAAPAPATPPPPAAPRAHKMKIESVPDTEAAS